MKHTRITAITAALFLLLTLPLWARGGQEKEQEAETSAPAVQEETREEKSLSRDELAARVNGRGISREEFDDVVETNIYRFEMHNDQSFPQDRRGELERQVLDGLITRTVLETEAETQGIVVTDEQLSEALEQFRSQFPDRESYRAALEQQGFSEDLFEAEVLRQIAIETLINTRAFEGLTVDEATAREFYDAHPDYFERPEQVAARHILLSAEEGADKEQLRSRLGEIRQQLLDGADFGEMAREYSDCPSSAEGGELGAFGRGQMVPSFEEAAFSLDAGELSDIVETQFGFHLVQVTERIPGRVIAFTDVLPEIEEFLLEDLQNEAARNYVTSLREAAQIEEFVQID
ncbi:peptidyl-prolyl cis-trans isomerase C [Alkalispirochaeta americana]|uniref:Peptidyl-prolyl cis-trans isomerase C n=1 Tax=Alkalispirochaeta americana TaxID=159291 RepID=A0A1N6NBQ3_9SPIO|nr:peptidylprolyl isomerase [Alkalispirochaeta americana]SIP89514.1 peptidyl-prolyl cis-trans isomerase C [Alkalispirochaeta americana]